jgi:hypothetical protein
MSFLHLYQHVEALAAKAESNKAPVEVVAIRDWIMDSGHASEIKVHAVSLNRDLSPGHVIIRDYREDRWDDPDFRASIRISDKLNRCGFRLVVCKEMMHIFDNEDESANAREKFYILLDEIETPPVPGGPRSEMLGSEFRAEWMALLLLCPKPLRDEYKAKLDANEITPYDVAWKFLIPQVYVRSLMSHRYDEAYQWLITDQLEPAPEDPNEVPPKV